MKLVCIRTGLFNSIPTNKNWAIINLVGLWAIYPYTAINFNCFIATEQYIYHCTLAICCNALHNFAALPLFMEDKRNNKARQTVPIKNADGNPMWRCVMTPVWWITNIIYIICFCLTRSKLCLWFFGLFVCLFFEPDISKMFKIWWHFVSVVYPGNIRPTGHSLQTLCPMAKYAGELSQDTSTVLAAW